MSVPLEEASKSLFAALTQHGYPDWLVMIGIIQLVPAPELAPESADVFAGDHLQLMVTQVPPAIAALRSLCPGLETGETPFWLDYPVRVRLSSPATAL